MASHTVRRRLTAAVVTAAGVVLLAVSVTALLTWNDRTDPGPAPAAVSPQSALARSISSAQARLRANPHDPTTWAMLGEAYVEQARLTADPSYYPKAQGALETSLRQLPDGNGAALIGMGALANARHDFAAARDWGERAKAALPDTAQVYGVLADAYTQLGDSVAATDAVQHMLDLRPGVSAFTRASYDQELHGDVEDAWSLLDRALGDAVDPTDVVFCRYYLGELAFNSGQLDQASQQYEHGLLVDPSNVALLQGRAKVAAARGHLDDAIAGYRDIVARVPLPQYLHEYAVLLLAAGRTGEADQQFAILDQQATLQAAAGASDNLTTAFVDADRGDKAGALTAASAEWARRHNVLAADALAWALHLNRRDAEALGYADQAAALGWHNASFAFHRGMILAALGRTAAATDALTDALHTNPFFSPLDARTAADTLATLGSTR